MAKIPELMRTIVEDVPVSKKVDASSKKNDNVEVVFDALKWRLSRKPSSGMPLNIRNPGDFYVLSSARAARSNVRIVVLYQFNDDEVNIRSVKIELL